MWKTMNGYLIVILVIIALRLGLELVSNVLNLRHIKPDLPQEFEGFYDEEKYCTSQQYLVDNTRFGICEDVVQTLVVVVFMLAGGFNLVDGLARSVGVGTVTCGLVFAAVLGVGGKIISLPFSIYGTFVIEERYGFNKTTARTFVGDILKGALLGVIIGGPVLALVIWFFDAAGSLAWLYCWGAVVAFQVCLVFVAPYTIMPLFNKFEPLDEGPLKEGIEEYAAAQKFRMKGVFKMDGSRRSARSNAFFTGFGRSRRIVLFDTLIEKHTVPELVAIVAHEMGHYKKRHILWGMIRSIVQAGLMFFLLSLMMGNEGVFEAFRMEHVSVYAGLFFFGFLYTPVGMVISVVEHAISRRQEYQADRFAVETAGDVGAMVSGLKKLSVDNLSNLTPHPMVVWLGYSHPPVLERIAALRNMCLPLSS